MKLLHSREFAAGIVEAKIAGTAFKFHGNVINRGLIDNFHPAAVNPAAFPSTAGVPGE